LLESLVKRYVMTMVRNLIDDHPIYLSILYGCGWSKHLPRDIIHHASARPGPGKSTQARGTESRKQAEALQDARHETSQANRPVRPILVVR
jgi:hypothetical protein